MMKITPVLLALTLCLAPLLALAAEETPEEHEARMAWWRDARFGMFIHWGVYSVPAGTYHGKQIPGIGEWIMHDAKIPMAEYQGYAKEFNPVNYDPDAWVKMAKDAGMKYIVITSKHHDGFALFDSKVTDWDVVDATPYGKDLLKPLAEACRKHGLKLGFYYSQAQDWNHPGGAAAGGHWDPAQDGDMDEYIRTIAVPQVKEILTNYGDIAILWWDTPVNMNQERADMLHPLIDLQPGLITNNRLGVYPGDTDTPEQYIPPTGIPGRDWEVCMTMNDTWGFKSYDDHWKSTETLIRNLVDIASKGGNYLLNVGPNSLGEIPQPSIHRLKEVGDWMDVNGEAIYGTTASPFRRLSWGRCTQKPGLLYLHVFDWPADGQLLVPGLKTAVDRAWLLADAGKDLSVSVSPDGPIIALPQSAPSPISSTVVLAYSGDLDVEEMPLVQAPGGEVALTAADASLHGSQLRYEGGHHNDNIGFWTDPAEWVGWMVKMTQPGTYSVSAQIAAPRASGFTLAIGDQQLDCKAQKTKDFTTFKTVDLGEVTIAEPGVVAVSVKPVAEDWLPINLRSVTLKPKK